MAVGCIEPPEQTYKWALATLLVTHYDTPPETKKVHSMLMDLKTSFKSEKKDFGFTRIMDYPDSPFELPPDIFQAAYPGDDQPSKIELKGINAVADKISLRPTRGALVPSPNDPYEMGLFYEHLQKLLDHRKEISQAAAQGLPAPHMKSEQRSSLAIHRAADGTLKAQQAVKHEPRVKHEPEAKREEQDAEEQDAGKGGRGTADDDDGPREEDLGTRTRAAIPALKKRKAKAKEDTKAKALAKKGAADAAKDAAALEVKADAPPRKRPAAAAAAVKHVKAAKVEPAEAAKGGGKSKDADLKPIPKSKLMGDMPSLPKDGSNPPPVAYKQGIIYTSVKLRRFRAL
ncbi:unnamed protein product, partial [Prorocentrum cordatum]